MELSWVLLLLLGLCQCARERIPIFSAGSVRALSKTFSRAKSKRVAAPYEAREPHFETEEYSEQRLYDAVREFEKLSKYGKADRLDALKVEIQKLAKKLDNHLTLYNGEDWEGLINVMGLNHERQIVEMIRANM
jgi:hypothetical protein